MKKPSARDVLGDGAKHLIGLGGHVFDVLEVSRPVSPEAAVNLAKVISKLSPLLGNLIEFNTVEVLNEHTAFGRLGKWARQDPGFPDTVFRGNVDPEPGIEIKAWFPLSTEITARFRDSQQHFIGDNIDVALLAWLPEHLIYGKPRILDVCVVSGQTVARSRDDHYHDPPDYLVLEPEDTSERTSNLQQTNTAGYKWQGTLEEFEVAKKIVKEWGPKGGRYDPHPEYQTRLRELTGRFKYRLDTNYAKMDRIVHPGIEEFKSRVMKTTVHGRTVQAWSRLLCSENDLEIADALKSQLGIKKADADELIE